MYSVKTFTPNTHTHTHMIAKTKRSFGLMVMFLKNFRSLPSDLPLSGPQDEGGREDCGDGSPTRTHIYIRSGDCP